MSIPISAATARISSQLGAVERKADDMLISLNELMVSMLRARSNPELAVHTGQRALVRLMASRATTACSGFRCRRCRATSACILMAARP